MAQTPGIVVGPPPSPPRRRGLYDAATLLQMPTGGQSGGIRYLSPACGQHAVAYPVSCAAPPAKPIADRPDEIATSVFATVAAVGCSPLGGTAAEYMAEATLNLETSEQGVVEQALWNGQDFQGNALGIPNLTGDAIAVTVGYDETSLASVVGALLSSITDVYGSVPTLIAPMATLPYAAGAHLIIEEGRVLRLPGGTLWAFGNYPEGQLFATGQVSIWRSPISTYDSFDPATNEQLAVAERTISVAFECVAFKTIFLPLGS